MTQVPATLMLAFIFTFLIHVGATSPVPCGNITYAGRLYRYCPHAVDRTTAASNCQNMSMALIAFETQDEFDFWSSHLGSSGSAWVGAMKRADNNYYWDGTNTKVKTIFFLNWATLLTLLSAAEDCVSMDKQVGLLGGHGLTDNTCTDSKDYICEEVTEVTTVPDTTPDSTTSALTTDSDTTESSTVGVTTENTSEDILTAGLTADSTPEATSTNPSTQQTTQELETMDTPVINILPALPSAVTSVAPKVIITNVSVELPSLSNITSLSTLLPPVIDDWETCLCGCPLVIPTNETELQQLIDDEVNRIEESLHVDTETLSSTVRKKTSATDDRPSAKSVGAGGVIVLIVVFGSIVFWDISNYCTMTKHSPTSKSRDKVS